MNGKGNVRFSELFADTVQTHGLMFAMEYYVVNHGMEYWEFVFWCHATNVADTPL